MKCELYISLFRSKSEVVNASAQQKISKKIESCSHMGECCVDVKERNDCENSILIQSVEKNVNRNQLEVLASQLIQFAHCMPKNEFIIDASLTHNTSCKFYVLPQQDATQFAEKMRESFPLLLNKVLMEPQSVVQIFNKFNRITTTANNFYGASLKAEAELIPLGKGFSNNQSWGNFQAKFKNIIENSRCCQVEGSAPAYQIFHTQQKAFEFADSVSPSSPLSYPRVYSFENPSNGKRKFLVSDDEVFWKKYESLEPSKAHVYEIIRENTPCRLYFDLEFIPSINPSFNGINSLKRLIQLIALQLYRYYDIIVKPNNFLDLDSSSTEKFSHHLIVHLPGNKLFLNNLEVGKFVQKLVDDLVMDCSTANGESDSTFFVYDKNNSKSLIIDMGVYTRNRAFRLQFSSKFGKSSILKVFSINGFTYSGSMDSKDLFFYSLVCPFPTFFAMQKNYSILNNPEMNLLSARLTYSSISTIKSRRKVMKNICKSYSGYKESPYPRLDSFILSVLNDSNKDEIGEIGSWNIAYEESPDKNTFNSTSCTNSSNISMDAASTLSSDTDHNVEPILIVYSMRRNRWCENIQRAHKSNNVMYVVDFKRKMYYQKCYDNHCRAINYSSPARFLPDSIL